MQKSIREKLAKKKREKKRKKVSTKRSFFRVQNIWKWKKKTNSHTQSICKIENTKKNQYTNDKDISNKRLNSSSSKYTQVLFQIFTTREEKIQQKIINSIKQKNTQDFRQQYSKQSWLSVFFSVNSDFDSKIQSKNHS